MQTISRLTNILGINIVGINQFAVYDMALMWYESPLDTSMSPDHVLLYLESLWLWGLVTKESVSRTMFLR